MMIVPSTAMDEIRREEVAEEQGVKDLGVIMHGWPLGSAPAGQPRWITKVWGR
jgi:hypothetical protein